MLLKSVTSSVLDISLGAKGTGVSILLSATLPEQG